MSVVNGLAALRNTFGDAHGKAPNTPKLGHNSLDQSRGYPRVMFLMAMLTRIATRGNRGPKQAHGPPRAVLSVGSGRRH